MKKNIVAFVCVCMTFAVSAQNKKAAPILKAGVNFSNVSISENGSVDNSHMYPSFHAGLLVDLPLAPGFSFQPGLLLTGKGAKTESGQPTDNNFYRSTSNPWYAEVPLNFIGRIPAGNSSVFLGAGPYIATGIGGKNKVEGKFLGKPFSSERNIEFSNDNPATLDYEEGAGIGRMKRFDAGANFIGGIDFNGFIISANYGLGFTKINSGGDNSADNKNKNRVFSLSLGLRL